MSSALSTRLKIWFVIATITLVGSFAARYFTFSRLTNTSHEAASTPRRAPRTRRTALLAEGCRDRPARLSDYRRPEYLKPYEKASKTLDEDETRLAVLIGDDSTQRQRLTELRKIIDEKLSELKSTIQRRDLEGFEAAKAIVEADQGRHLMGEAGKLVDTMIAGEQRRLDDEQQQLRRPSDSI